MTRSRRLNLLQLAAIVIAVVILNVIWPQPWHVTIANVVIAAGLGLGFGAGSAAGTDLIRRRKGNP